MRLCFIIGLLLIAVAGPFTRLRAEVQVKSVIRADSHTGRLVRGIVVVNPDRALDATARENFGTLIEKIAKQQDVEAPLVHSVIRAESNYNPYAISPKGARGLMQLIPATARRFGATDSFNPEQNIEAGVRYLKYLLDLYRNDYSKAVAAYNAGEGAVSRYGGIPPYAETREYVIRVARNLRLARKAAGEQAAVAASVAPASSETYNPIQASVSADGRVVYRTP